MLSFTVSCCNQACLEARGQPWGLFRESSDNFLSLKPKIEIKIQKVRCRTWLPHLSISLMLTDSFIILHIHITAKPLNSYFKMQRKQFSGVLKSQGLLTNGPPDF